MPSWQQRGCIDLAQVLGSLSFLAPYLAPSGALVEVSWEPCLWP